MNAVVLSDGVTGDGPAREVVWLVDVRRQDGSYVAQRFVGDGVYVDEDRAEDEAVALAGRLSIPLIDERTGVLPEPGGLVPCQPDTGDAA